MSESDMAELLSEHDSANMADLTRSFVDDFEAAINRNTGLNSDTDWSGVVCLGTVSYTHLRAHET